MASLDAVKKVAAFYKSKMSEEGWQSVYESEQREELLGGIWQKKDGDVVTVVTILENKA